MSAEIALRGPEREHQLMDRLEAEMLDNPGLVPIHMPVTHRFTPGLYSREIFMPGPRENRSGAILTSRGHATEHQFVVLAGVALVRIPGEEPELLEAGHVGITRPGTRRALEILEDCRWVTFHPLAPEEETARAAGASEQELVAMVEARIIGDRDRPDGRDTIGEYQERLRAAGLPGVHERARALPEGGA